MTLTLVLKIFLAYFLPCLFGYQLLSLLDRNLELSRGLKVFVGTAVGIGIFTLEVFTAAILGVSLKLGTFLAILGANILVLELLIRWRLKKWLVPFSHPQPHPNPLLSGRGEKGEVTSGKENWIFYLVSLLILIKVGVSIWQVTHIPTYEFDAWNNWNLRAKVIFTEQEIPLDKSDPFYLGGGIKSYPLNDGLWKVWIGNIISSWNENLVGLSSVVFYVVLLGLFYFSLSENFNRTWKIIATYLLASLPFLYFHSWIPYADLEFAAYLFLAISTFYRFLDSNSPRSPSLVPLTLLRAGKEGGRGSSWLWVSAIALALTIWTKNEGFAVVLPIIFITSVILAVVKRLTIRQVISYWLLVIVVSAPWLIFRFINKLDVLSGDSSTFEILYNSQFLKEAFFSVFLRSHFNFLWLLVVALFIFGFKKIWQDLPKKFLMIVLVILFLFYNGIIIFTDKAQDLGALVRVNLHLVPIAFFLVILILSEILEGHAPSTRS